MLTNRIECRQVVELDEKASYLEGCQRGSEMVAVGGELVDEGLLEMEECLQTESELLQFGHLALQASQFPLVASLI